MTKEEQKKQVLIWWHTDRDYQRGLTLFAQFSKNRFFARNLASTSERFGRKKLEYELTKCVRLDRKAMPELPQELVPDTKQIFNPLPPITDIKVSSHVPIISDKKLAEYPPIVRRLKYEYSECYRERGRHHKNMADVPPVNTPENSAKRKDCLLEIDKLSVRMDFLYPFIKNFEENNIMPAEDIIWPKPKQTKPLTLEDLKKERSNLRNANYKDNNRLRFSTSTKQNKENPMPDGIKRKTIIARRDKKDTRIKEVELLIFEYPDAD